MVKQIEIPNIVNTAELVEKHLNAVEITSVGQSRYREILNACLVFNNLQEQVPFSDETVRTFSDQLFEFKLGKREEPPENPFRSRHKRQTEYGRLTHPLRMAKRVLCWNRPPKHVIVQVLGPRTKGEKGVFPCTIGYSFILREKLHCTAVLRSSTFPYPFLVDVEQARLHLFDMVDWLNSRCKNFFELEVGGLEMFIYRLWKKEKRKRKR